jgi:DNA polymerase
MLHLSTHRDFNRWRMLAREMLHRQVPPDRILWSDEASEGLLLGEATTEAPQATEGNLSVPRAFLDIAQSVSCHRDSDRWNLLYRSLWRLTHGEANLLERAADDDTHRLNAMERAVRRDAHKMTAFVRFRLVRSEEGERYVAWHRPEHFIVRRTAPFFARRFATLHWTILTPDDSATWDGKELSFGLGVPRWAAPADDELEGMWRTYYANIFNPARIKIRAMKRELPVRHWSTLPETQLIPDLLAEAPGRVSEMIRKARQAAKPSTSRSLPGHGGGLFDQPGPDSEAKAGKPKKAHGRATPDWGAEKFIPATLKLPVLAKASKECRGCDLCEVGTQTVFGEGPKDALVMFVGEQPGDQEDRAGKPFVGPAGQLLDRVLEEVGVMRDECYVTNAVKHFKWEPRGTKRIHAKPSAREVAACRPWLETEIKAIQPPMLVCLGSTAAQSLLGRDFRVTKSRGEPMESEWAKWTMATVHPSSLLRMPDEAARKEAYQLFTRDLMLVAKQIKKLKSARN